MATTIYGTVRAAELYVGSNGPVLSLEINHVNYAHRGKPDQESLVVVVLCWE